MYGVECGALRFLLQSSCCFNSRMSIILLCLWLYSMVNANFFVLSVEYCVNAEHVHKILLFIVSGEDCFVFCVSMSIHLLEIWINSNNKTKAMPMKEKEKRWLRGNVNVNDILCYIHDVWRVYLFLVVCFIIVVLRWTFFLFFLWIIFKVSFIWNVLRMA